MFKSFHLCQKKSHMWGMREIVIERIETNSAVYSILLLKEYITKMAAWEDEDFKSPYN